MSDTKHTPGEWYVEKGKTYFFIDSPESPTKSIAQVYEEANADLIAASKDLLAYAEAEQAAEDHRAECIYCSVGGCIQWEKMRDDAEVLRIAALAKARGEQE